MPHDYQQGLGPGDGDIEALGVAPEADEGAIRLDAAGEGPQHAAVTAALCVRWEGGR